MKLLFGSDFHGNIFHFQKLVSVAQEHVCNAIILGGDLCPRGGALKAKLKTSDDTSIIVGQYEWFRDELAPVLATSTIPVFLIFGNSDRSVIYAQLKHEFESPLLTFVKKETVKLPGGEYSLYGYPHVPASDHKAKDWEKLDLGPEDLRTRILVLDGTVSDSGRIEAGSVSTALSQSILWDMEHLDFEPEDCAKMVWVTHAPPYGTNLDLNHGHAHVGSVAIHRAIEKYQPLATFHGHIHETVKISGQFVSKIGRTVSCSSGNNFHHETAHFVLMDLQNPEGAQRLEA